MASEPYFKIKNVLYYITEYYNVIQTKKKYRCISERYSGMVGLILTKSLHIFFDLPFFLEIVQHLKKPWFYQRFKAIVTVNCFYLN